MLRLPRRIAAIRSFGVMRQSASSRAVRSTLIRVSSWVRLVVIATVGLWCGRWSAGLGRRSSAGGSGGDRLGCVGVGRRVAVGAAAAAKLDASDDVVLGAAGGGAGAP